jgi:SAM-dependent methyltransferase
LALLFAAAVFASAALLFLVEPMIAKMALPQLGGTPAVWNTCMVFFQAALLIGYALADRVTSGLSLRKQAILLILLLILPLAVLPIDLENGARLSSLLKALPEGSRWVEALPAMSLENPIPWLLGNLLIAVGLPFMVLSMMGPLLQKWFSGTRARFADDPYRLYAASNLGSMLALLAYPAVMEPAFTLQEQSRLWSYGYGLLLLLAFICAVLVWRAPPRGIAKKAAPRVVRDQEQSGPPDPITMQRRLRWVALAFVPSSLMLGVTTYLSTDIATIPLLWIVPLALYLLTFILVFAKRQLLPRAVLGRILPGLTLLLFLLILLHDMQPPAWLVIFLHLFTFFVLALYCHGELAADRPRPDQLTEFYLWLGVGGALGGLFNALLAPLLFTQVLEYPLALILACAMRYQVGRGDSPTPQSPMTWAVPAVLGLLTAGLIVSLQAYDVEPAQLRAGLMFGVPAVLCYTQVDRPLRFALCLGAMLLASFLYVGKEGRTIFSGRSFFGVLRVTTDRDSHFHQVVHGNTVHGRQSLDPGRRHEPLAYYHRTGPAGRLFETLDRKLSGAKIAVVGLGAGSLACYAQPDQEWTFYEIDPLVERIARDPKYFTFLEDCRARKVNVVLGDGRLRLREAPDECYELILLDAFSSDAVPVHLLTREALQLYLRKLAKGGVLVFHISNRYLDLQPVLAALARDAKLLCRFRDDLIVTPKEEEEGKEKSQWAVMAGAPESLGPLARSSAWIALEGKREADVWTDHFSNILGIFMWR